MPGGLHPADFGGLDAFGLALVLQPPSRLSDIHSVTMPEPALSSGRRSPVRRGWGRYDMELDPLAVLLRGRYPNRAELARASGLSYQTLRTYTDGRWTAGRLPPVQVLAGLSQAVDPGELHVAVRQAMLARADDDLGPPALTWGQRVVLEALRGFDDELLVAVAPHVQELVAGWPPVRH